jgi:LPS-assembly lipoprotein
MKSMSFMKMRALLQGGLLFSALVLAGCGFHLRKNVSLPPSMQQIHLTIAGSGAFERMLARSLEVNGVNVVDDSGEGVAEFKLPVAVFSTDSLTNGGYVKITETAIHYHVEFEVDDAAGQPLLPLQRINMQREYSYDASNTIGNASQVDALEKSLQQDMVQAILFRLQAAAKQMPAAPASAASTH